MEHQEKFEVKHQLEQLVIPPQQNSPIKTSFFWISFVVYLVLIIGSVSVIFCQFPTDALCITGEKDLWKIRVHLWKIAVHLVHWSPLYIVLCLSIKKLLNTISVLEHYKKSENHNRSLISVLNNLEEEDGAALWIQNVKSLQPQHPNFGEKDQADSKITNHAVSVDLLKNLNGLISELKQLISHLKSK